MLTDTPSIDGGVLTIRVVMLAAHRRIVALLPIAGARARLADLPVAVIAEVVSGWSVPVPREPSLAMTRETASTEPARADERRLGSIVLKRRPASVTDRRVAVICIISVSIHDFVPSYDHLTVSIRVT